MDERVVQARVGIVVVSALVLTAILIVLFGDVPTPFRSGKVIYIQFPNAPGVAEGTPVRKSGILVGRVDRVELMEDSSDVLVTLKLNDKAKLHENEVCRINSNSLLGDAVLEFVSVREPTEPLIADGARLKGVSGRNPLEMITSLEGDLRGTLQSVGTASEQFGKLATEMNDIVKGRDDQQLQRIVDKSERSLDSITATMNKLDRILGDDAMQDDLKKSLSEIPGIVQQTQSALAGVQRAVGRADQNLKNLEGLTGPLGQRGAEIVERIDSSIGQFDQVMNQLVVFTDRMNSKDGTLGQLMKDPELYNNLNRSISNIERLTAELRPIMSDVRVFSDKIARDPGQLGLAGALQRKKEHTKYPNFETSEAPPLTWREDLRPPADWREESITPTPIYPR